MQFSMIACCGLSKRKCLETNKRATKEQQIAACTNGLMLRKLQTLLEF